MPVARGPQINARSAVVVGLTGIVVAALLGGMVLWFANTNPDVVRIGDTTFDAGFIGRQADEVDARGPILYADAGTRRERDLFVQHIGDDPEVGWLAFSARRVGDPRDCSVEWDEDTRTFSLVSSTDFVCDEVTFDELGCGLERFPVEVIDDKVIVFLNPVDETDTDEDGDAEEEAEPAPAGPDLSCPES
ncbi:MAG: hypothetical protein AAF548_20640 [Actinomycetota bacterium]